MPIETFKVLLDAGAKINDEKRKSSCLSTSIHGSISLNKENVELCKFFLNAGAKPEDQFFENLSIHSSRSVPSLSANKKRKQECAERGELCAEIRKALAQHNIPDKS